MSGNTIFVGPNNSPVVTLTVVDGQLVDVLTGGGVKNLLVETFVNSQTTGAIVDPGGSVQAMTVAGAVTVNGLVSNVDMTRYGGWLTVGEGGSIQGISFDRLAGFESINGLFGAYLGNVTLSGQYNQLTANAGASVGGAVVQNSNTLSVAGGAFESGTDVQNGGFDNSGGSASAVTVEGGGTESVSGTATGGLVESQGTVNVTSTGLLGSYTVEGTANASAGSTVENLVIAGGTLNLAGTVIDPLTFQNDGTLIDLSSGNISVVGFDDGGPDANTIDISDASIATPTLLTLSATTNPTLAVGGVIATFLNNPDMVIQETPLSNGGVQLTEETPPTTGGMPCFASGTNILTPRGERLVEDLSVGDIVITNSGEKKEPIKWIGQRRIDLTRHSHPENVQPIRFEADCFADDVPTRDLFLSPDHALYIDGILVPAKVLINGKNICQIAVPDVTYYHVELDKHSVILAENTPAETYLETGNRGAFENCADAITLHPDFAQTEREAKGCAPFTESGPQVEAIRKRILDRANIQTTDDPALTVQYRDGSAIIQSRHAIPGLITPDPRDRRRLGVKVASIIVDGRHISFDHPALIEGWHDCEPDGRWTDGSAVIPAELLAGANDVSVILAATLPYRVAA